MAGMAYLKRHNDLLFPIVAAHRGRIVKTIGDAIMAEFESPLDAATCGAEMQRALVGERKREPRDPIHIRVGAHFGKVMIDDKTNDVFGDTVNTASRIEHAAVPDEVVLSRPLVEALPQGAFEILPRGSVAAKGKAEPVEIFSLRWGPEAPAIPKPERVSTSRGPIPVERDSLPEMTPTRAYEVFVLEIASGASGLKVSALDGAGDKGTVKAYEEVPIDRKGLDALAEPFAAFLQSGGASESYVDRIREAGAALYRGALSERVQHRLRTTPVQYLRLHLEDDLIHVPWELAHDGGEFLSLRFATGRMVAARAKNAPTVAPVDVSAPPVAVVVSNPSGDLPSAKEEGRAVAGLLKEGFRGTIRHLEGPVTKAAFLQALRGAWLLHFAGHAQRGTPTVRGGFRLSDGIATPEEVAVAVGNRAPALVFANSCHATGGGWTENAQGVFNLASALLMRGSQHFIGPMWETPDSDALSFALRFYENSLAGIPFGESARLGRAALAQGSRSPLSFAGYVLYGEPRHGFPAGLGTLKAQATRGAASAAIHIASSIASLAGAPTTSRRRPFMKTGLGRGIVAGAAVVGTAGAAGELLVSGKTLFGSADTPPAAVGTQAPGTPAPAGTEIAMLVPGTPAENRHEGPVRVSFMPLKNLSEADLKGVEFVLQEAGIAGLADSGVAVVERGQLDDHDRRTFDTVFDELVISNNTQFWNKETSAALGLQKSAEVVVLGGFQKTGALVRLNARFVNVETGEVLHSLKLDKPYKKEEDILDLQDAFEAEVERAVPGIKKKMRP